MAGENYKTSPFSSLPEDCIANIISLTSPKDACRAAAVSLGFKSAAELDNVWERFLPPDNQEILSGSTSPVSFSSKKELFFMLCDSGLLVDGGKLSFGLSRSTGKKCYMLSERKLIIIWGDTPTYWRKIPLPESRFAEVAELVWVCWLEICGEFQAQMLSPNTNYAAYLVYKISENHYGLDYSANATVTIVAENKTEIKKDTRTIFIVPPTNGNVLVPGQHQLPCIRPDGWQEIELGEFFIAEGETSDVKIRLLVSEHYAWKRGLIVEGIEVRPKEAF